jgi:hypothetical protein
MALEEKNKKKFNEASSALHSRHPHKCPIPPGNFHADTRNRCHLVN